LGEPRPFLQAFSISLLRDLLEKKSAFLCSGANPFVIQMGGRDLRSPVYGAEEKENREKDLVVMNREAITFYEAGVVPKRGGVRKNGKEPARKEGGTLSSP